MLPIMKFEECMEMTSFKKRNSRLNVPTLDDKNLKPIKTPTPRRSIRRKNIFNIQKILPPGFAEEVND